MQDAVVDRLAKEQGVLTAKDAERVKKAGAARALGLARGVLTAKDAARYQTGMRAKKAMSRARRSAR